MQKRVNAEDYGVMGLRYGSENLSFGTSFMPFPVSGERPISGWIVARRGNLTAGVQYKPPLEQKQSVSDLMDMKNWSYAVGYGVGSTSPFVPLSTLPSSLLATHRYANGFTLFYIVAVDCVVLSAHSCTNKFLTYPNFGSAATNDHAAKSTSFGFGLRIEDLRQPSYQRADPNYVMLTPSKEHLAEGVLRELGKRTVFQSEVDSGNYDRLPRELKPIGKIF
ncbi:beta-galactosidase [Rhynchospora pubera]|uniref:Beta-galactosidase n=1 Tax=Rhynchospora pubera TaxID=906938 RepID=A0AAV8FHJ3_9POAL|nr:beta-galactosidase [Rhynchospora pubera]